MKKTMKRTGYFFFSLMLLSLSIGIIAATVHAEKTPDSSKAALVKSSDTSVQPQPSLPDADSTILSSLLSALGGFGGGGLLLIFLIRRLVNSYDETFAKMEEKYDTGLKRQDERDEKLIGMINNVQETSQDLREEIIKLQTNAVDKALVTETITKVAMLETDIGQVRGEVQSIMTHLLNKPRMSGAKK